MCTRVLAVAEVWGRRQPTIQDVIDDIPPALGVPFTNMLFHRLAEHPTWLVPTWSAARPLVTSPAFDAAASVLRALAAPTDPPAELDPSTSGSPEAPASLRRLTDAYTHVQPRLLLLAAGWAEGLATAPGPAPVPHGASTLPRVHDAGSGVAMFDPTDPQDDRSLLLQAMTAARRHPGVASYYRSVATLPGMLRAVWQVVEPRVCSAEYRSTVTSLSAVATALARLIDVPASAAEPDPAHYEELSNVLTAWRDVQIPELLVDTATVRAALVPAASGWPPYSCAP